MRTDYILYIVAVICFIIAGIGSIYKFTTDFTSNTILVVVLAIIGIIFAVGGYSLRPTKPVVTRAEPSMPLTKPAMEEEQPTTAPPSMPEPKPEPTPAPESTPMSEPEKAEEKQQPETPPPETKPVRKRRERKKTA
jgi:outer membrane biosynthesis protein TonB